MAIVSLSSSGPDTPEKRRAKLLRHCAPGGHGPALIQYWDTHGFARCAVCGKLIYPYAPFTYVRAANRIAWLHAACLRRTGRL